MPPYVKQSWNDGVAGGTPISAARLNHMEDGIENPVDSIPSGTYAEVASTTITVTVGAGGDYASISAALVALGRKHKAFANGGFTATVRLLAGFTLTEQLKFENVDLGFITLISDDAEVPVPSENIPSGQGTFYAVGRAVLPKIGCFFRYVATGDIRATPALRGFDILHGSTIYFTGVAAGFGDDPTNKKCNRLLHVAHGSTAIGTSGLSLKDGNDIGLRAANASLVSVPNVRITDCSNNGIATSGAIVQAANAIISGSLAPVVLTPTSIVEVVNATLTSTGDYVISAEGGSVAASGATCIGGGVNATSGGYVDARNAVFDVDAVLRVATQGKIEATGRTNGTPTVTVNQYTRDGLIYDGNVVDVGLVTTVATVGLGNAGAPTVTFVGRPTDGLYSRGAGEVGVSGGGVERGYFSSQGFTSSLLRSKNGTGVGSVIVAGRDTDGTANLSFQNNGFTVNNAQLSATTNALKVIVGGADRITMNATGLGFNGAAAVAKSTGWGAATGTATKTTFDTATVTTAELAQRVKALLDYLTTRGDIGA